MSAQLASLMKVHNTASWLHAMAIAIILTQNGSKPKCELDVEVVELIGSFNISNRDNEINK